jgi:poly(3-hydroxybutyrate) depolymerase
MDANYYLETIRTVFQEFKLVNGTWDVLNRKGEPERVSPQDIRTTALMTVEGELDDISGSGQTAAAHDLCTGIDKSMKLHLEVEGAGHYGIFSGRRWRDAVYPQVKAFIAKGQARTDEAPPPPAKRAKSTAPAAKRTRAAATAQARPKATRTPRKSAARSAKLG